MQFFANSLRVGVAERVLFWVLGRGTFFPQRKEKGGLTKASPLIPNILSGFNAGAIRCFFSSLWGF